MEPIDIPLPNIIDVKTSSYFSANWKFVAYIFIFFGVIVMSVNIFVGLAMLLGGILVVTTQYRLRIDFNSNKYYDYTWVLWIKSGEKGRFDRIEYIYINQNRVSKTMSSRAQSTTIKTTEYNGYLKFSETQKIHLGSDEEKKDLLQQMQVLAVQFRCQLKNLSND